MSTAGRPCHRLPERRAGSSPLSTESSSVSEFGGVSRADDLPITVDLPRTVAPDWLVLEHSISPQVICSPREQYKPS